MSWWLPRQASTFGPSIDGLFTAILIITGIAFFVVEIGLVWFAIKYRARPGQKAFYTHGSTKVEVIWTAVPAVTVVVLGIVSNGAWVHMKGKHSTPADAIPVVVRGKQFEWNMTHSGADKQLGTADDVKVRNQLHIPVNTPIDVHLEAEEVIHSFFVPEFRLKQDAVPGMNIKAWFQATDTGVYEIGCAELCGMGHYKMRARVWVHTAEGYQAWLDERAAAAAAAAAEVAP
jgi:cytochrome c oxidase subunit 2